MLLEILSWDMHKSWNQDVDISGVRIVRQKKGQLSINK